ncbi:MAG: hypothetical protein LCI03_14460, partial [Actinobacteria bacterium]|nr:hypothetical protein [Actinomycetota bacterium]
VQISPALVRNVSAWLWTHTALMPPSRWPGWTSVGYANRLAHLRRFDARIDDRWRRLLTDLSVEVAGAAPEPPAPRELIQAATVAKQGSR